MTEKLSHTVDVIKSAQGVTVYSTITHEGHHSDRTQEGFKPAWEDSENRFHDRLHSRFKFARITDRLRFAEKTGASLFILKDLATLIGSGRLENLNDVLIISGIYVAFIATKLARLEIINDAIITKQKLDTVKEAKAINLPQYQKVFDLNKLEEIE